MREEPDSSWRMNDREGAVTVIVPCFRPDFASLQQCVDAILEQAEEGMLAELILIDNHPQPCLTRRIGARPRLRILHEPRAGSYSARNRGIRDATGEVLAFTDADCRPARDWLREGLDFLTSQPDCDFAAGAIEMYFRVPGAARPFELYDSLVHLRQEAYVKQEHYGATANLFVRRSAFARAGLFASTLMSSGDREWGLRAGRAGCRLGYAPRAIVRHPARATFRELAAKARRVRGGEVSGRSSQKLTDLARELWESGRWRFRLVRKQKSRLGLWGLYQVFIGIVALQAISFLETLRLRNGGLPRR